MLGAAYVCYKFKSGMRTLTAEAVVVERVFANVVPTLSTSLLVQKRAAQRGGKNSETGFCG